MEIFFDVPASFTNPFSGVRVWCIVCPSHKVRHLNYVFFILVITILLFNLQLKSLVSALFNSGVNRTKHFCKAGAYFGWDTIERMWT